jgi:hypothetical protein
LKKRIIVSRQNPRFNWQAKLHLRKALADNVVKSIAQKTEACSRLGNGKIAMKGYQEEHSGLEQTFTNQIEG